MTHTSSFKTLGFISGTALLMATSASAHFIGVAGNNSIDGSLCVGLDCVAEEAFGFDTLRLKENNLRLNFTDTSAAANFPGDDWTLRINDSANGGANYFAIENVTGGRTPFRVEAGARNNALFVDGQGDLGIGTSTPATDIDIKIGDSPTVRLQQDGSSGFAPQTWDLAGNETNFFIRDVTHGSTLPFRIRPEAPTNSIFVKENGDVGLGTASPGAPLEISTSDAFVFFRMTATGAANDSADVTYTNGPGGAGEIRYNIVDADGFEMGLDADGNLTITGELTTAGSCSIGCDRVFDEDYAMLSLQEHTDAMWAQGYLPNVGPTVEGDPFNVSDKLGRVLNELEHAHIYISQQQDMISDLQAAQDQQATTHAEQIAALMARLTALETR